MTSQGEIIRDINSKSDETVLNTTLPAGQGSSSIQGMNLLLRSSGVLLNSLLFKGELFRGRAGWIKSVNDWAYSFVTGAKLLEKRLGDDKDLIAKSRDFL